VSSKFLMTSEAAKITSKTQRTILNYIKKGKISATKDESGNNMIDPAELYRVFPECHPEFKNKPIESKIEKLETVGILKAQLLAEREKTEILSTQLTDIKSLWKQSLNILEHKKESVIVPVERSRKLRRKFLGIF
jgi:hypothetical protein